MTILSMVQSCAVRIGIQIPSTVIGNSSVEVSELLEFAQEEGRELVKRGDWQMLRKEFTFATTATETQTNYATTDVDRFIADTIWNRTRKLPLFGPLNAKEWQSVKSLSASPVYNSFTFRGGNFLISPTPTAGDNVYGEYISKNFCQTSGGAGQSAWAADTDTGVLDERIMGLGVIVRFKAAKGLDYSTDIAKYETQVQQALEQDKPSGTIDMAGIRRRGPGVVVPEGSWPL